jgi:hypothetical protein
VQPIGEETKQVRQRLDHTDVFKEDAEPFLNVCQNLDFTFRKEQEGFLEHKSRKGHQFGTQR